MDEERVVLTHEQAMEMLPDGEVIHTFVSPGYGMMIGADWSREEISDALHRSIRIELSGETATGMGHGLCFWRGSKLAGKWIFVETKKAQS